MSGLHGNTPAEVAVRNAVGVHIRRVQALAIAEIAANFRRAAGDAFGRKANRRHPNADRTEALLPARLAVARDIVAEAHAGDCWRDRPPQMTAPLFGRRCVVN